MPNNESPKITRLERRIIEAAASIMDGEVDSPDFIHSVLCQVGLPRRSTKALTFERSSGTAAIEIAAGKLLRGGKFQQMPLPYGPRPRLVLVHICSEAVKTRSVHVDVGHSMRDFMQKLNINPVGHEYRSLKKQMEALAACRMTLGMRTPTKEVTINTQPIRHFEAWISWDDRQPAFWPGSLELSKDFLETVIENAVPLDWRALAALQKSALALDIYTWLAHRLCRIRKADGVKVSWANLKQQFGQEYAVSKDFKKEFRLALRKVLAVYPDAHMDEEIGGLRLYSSPPPIPKSQVLALSRQKS